MKSKYLKLGLGCVIVVAIVMTCVCSRLAVVYEASSGFRYELQSRLKSGGAAEQGDIYVDVLEDRLQKWRSDHVKDLVIEFFRHSYPSLSVPEEELRQEVDLAQIGLGKKGLRVFQIVVRARWPEVCAGLANAYVEAISAYTDEENRMRNDRAVAQIHSAVEHSQRIVERIGRKLSKFEGPADGATSKAALEAQWAKEMACLNEWRQKEAKYRKLSEDNDMAVEFAWRAVVSKLLVWRGVQCHACLPQDEGGSPAAQ